ncbi:hypothetical protein SAMN04488116_2826 [Flagellimonas flava]|uniref:Uncharacterized protein n=1 Tax=Flagellimonas flava TaxID=570519 RepID=A0A1M5NJ42_9FLAO|nr:hypothetical protein SAMN04488116_2826 [Allomuricauda flava]
MLFGVPLQALLSFKAWQTYAICTIFALGIAARTPPKACTANSLVPRNLSSLKPFGEKDW